MFNLRRREFITLLGGAAAAVPIAARGQQSRIPVIGFLGIRTPEFDAAMLAEFRQGLREQGYAEGTNVSIDFRWARGQFDRLPTLADDLVRQGVALLVTSGGTAAARAAKSATATIPIVFSIGDDPVQFGLVASLGRPGGNITGVTNFYGALASKQLGLLRELVPKADVIAVLVNPNEAASESQIKDAETAAREIGQQLIVFKAASKPEIDAAFTTLVQQRAGALLLGANPFFATRADRLFALTARHSMPAMYWRSELAKAGGLMSYGAIPGPQYRQTGVYAGRILKGARPTDLPIVQPSKFELVINLKTAKALGLDVPPTLLARADEVIE
jgi:putative tryptophan/tyrosine transport system substrate-binding protein